MRIHADPDPDPKHCIQQIKISLEAQERSMLSIPVINPCVQLIPPPPSGPGAGVKCKILISDPRCFLHHFCILFRTCLHQLIISSDVPFICAVEVNNHLLICLGSLHIFIQMFLFLEKSSQPYIIISYVLYVDVHCTLSKP